MPPLTFYKKSYFYVYTHTYDYNRIIQIYKEKFEILIKMFKLRYKFLIKSLIIIFIISILYNRFVLPPLFDVAEKYVTTRVNSEISSVYKRAIYENNLVQKDFISHSVNNGTNYVEANTIAINKLCGYIGENVSHNLNNLPEGKIKFPIGIITGMPVFANLGANIPIKINPVGMAKTDSFSEFKSCGVNQVNYRLWIDIEVQVRAVTPILNKNIVINRQILVVDMIYNGGVPHTYLNGINRMLQNGD